ncbi:hypothetical protein K435DRAFT_580583, partial [Dendrothele bispora CBS 962.96]
MNSWNGSTGMSMFQLKTGRSPRLLPPLTPSDINALPDKSARTGIKPASVDSLTKDSLLASKVTQAFQANKSRGSPGKFKVGDLVMLTTVHRRRQYAQAGQNRIAK